MSEMNRFSVFLRRTLVFYFLFLHLPSLLLHHLLPPPHGSFLPLLSHLKFLLLIYTLFLFLVILLPLPLPPPSSSSSSPSSFLFFLFLFILLPLHPPSFSSSSSSSSSFLFILLPVLLHPLLGIRQTAPGTIDPSPHLWDCSCTEIIATEKVRREGGRKRWTERKRIRKISLSSPFVDTLLTHFILTLSPFPTPRWMVRAELRVRRSAYGNLA